MTRGAYVREILSARKLRAQLDRDLTRRAIVADRGGKISRRHYATIFGCSPSALSRFIYVFTEYEQKFSIATGPMHHYSEMRKWLTEMYETRKLSVRGDKLDRVAFAAKFSLRGGAYITRYPKIRKLFEDFDERARRDNYIPGKTRLALDRVKAVLAGDPVLNKDRVTINQIELAKMAGVPNTRLRSRHFVDAIAARQGTITARVVESRIDPFVHGRVFAFTALTRVWSRSFVRRIATRFKQTGVGMARATAKAPYQQLVNALEWIGTSSDPHCRAVVRDAARFGKIVSVDEWEEALFAYRDHLTSAIVAESATKASIDSRISALRIALNTLASARVVPSTAVPLPGVKHANRLTGHIRSVAELGSQSRMRCGSDGYVEFARDRYLEVCGNSGTDMGKGDSDEFIDGLAVDLSFTHELPSDPAAAVRLVLERRLSALRLGASNIVDAAIEALRRGRHLLSLARIDGVAFERDYVESAHDSYRRQQLVHSFFPSSAQQNDGERESGIANLLVLIRQCHGGIPPRGASSSYGNSYGQFFAKRYLEYGGMSVIEPLLLPNAKAVGAVLTLYLIESGANVSVGRTLDTDCIEHSDVPAHCRITGHKARAKGRPIVVDLPQTSRAVSAMQWLLSAGGQLRAAANRDNDRLFLMRIGNRVQLMTPHWYNSWFKRFASTTLRASGVTFVPSMIRPSVLLHAALCGEGRLVVGKAIAQHGLAVSQGYQQKWPTKLLYDDNIRRFQRAFETVVLSGVPSAAAKLGLTVAKFNARIGNLRETGLGTFCADQRGREREPGKTCSTLDCWNSCPHMLIVAEVDAIATLQLWQKSLRAAQPDWERDRPERWDEVWLPWLCLTDVVEEKMVRGPMISVWAAATRRASEVSARPDFVAPRPW